jgi:hypothetical protein
VRPEASGREQVERERAMSSFNAHIKYMTFMSNLGFALGSGNKAEADRLLEERAAPKPVNLPTIDEANDDFNDGGESNVAQFSNDNG